jgi:hypothetical protein
MNVGHRALRLVLELKFADLGTVLHSSMAQNERVEMGLWWYLAAVAASYCSIAPDGSD